MWSSIFSIDVMYVWNLAADSEDFWCRWTRDRVKDIGEMFCVVFFFLPPVYIAYILCRGLMPKDILSNSGRDEENKAEMSAEKYFCLT